MPSSIRAVLFDLDGTLIDSAPDLAGSINAVRANRGHQPLPYEQLRPMVGTGARGMIGVAFGLTPADSGFDALRDEFLAIYERDMLLNTRVFEAMQPVLSRLESRSMPWGVVTNKATNLAAPIVHGLGLGHRAGTVVCGDTTPHLKPHPAPLFEAARQLGIPASACVYIGDDERDVVAARAAGMPALAAAWGYLGAGPPIEAWGADAVLASPGDLLHWLDLP